MSLNFHTYAKTSTEGSIPPQPFWSTALVKCHLQKSIQSQTSALQKSGLGHPCNLWLQPDYISKFSKGQMSKSYTNHNQKRSSFYQKQHVKLPKCHYRAPVPSHIIRIICVSSRH
ncbi:hypothetical protein KC19_4G195800 [Ceratodon purpureus]|uniref:Uncharacterized protein n=1 Tax=Ceratodon purpureus TaxID=3225 RepID=A0A8T0IE29_CERPU|nr:hypothetical protein KC19_N024900 [Ceratodon purpureus]KAG0580743.1 hypothetical protein KC19_4G195800 [Ceratodon purpureus]